MPGSIDRHSRENGNPGLGEIRPQVSPMWIGLLDQLHLPCALPFFHLLLAFDRASHVLIEFIVHQLIDLVLLRKALDLALLVFPYSANEVIRDADVKCSIPTVRKDVKGWLFVHKPNP